MKIQSIEDLQLISRDYGRKLYGPEDLKVNIGMASCGIAAGAQAAYDKAIDEYPANNGVSICQTGCIGFCEVEPLVEVLGSGKPRLIYKKVTAEKIKDVIEGYKANDFDLKMILGQMKDPRSLLEDDVVNPLDGVEPIDGIPTFEDVSFYGNQVKVAMRNCGYIDPDVIEEYMARKGYLAFFNALKEMKPSEIIGVIKASGLRGRGGGGFPTGIKWATCAKHKGDRTIICNADEGDPGAYMDRSILEGDPHSVIEGMLIAAVAIGSRQGFHLRSE